MFSNEVMTQLSQYFATRNKEHLDTAVEVLEEEIKNPSLQEALITVPYTSRKQLVDVVCTKNYFKASMNDLSADKPVEEGRLIRVAGNDGADAPLIMYVAHLDPAPETGTIVLAPILGHLE